MIGIRIPRHHWRSCGWRAGRLASAKPKTGGPHGGRRRDVSPRSTRPPQMCSGNLTAVWASSGLLRTSSRARILVEPFKTRSRWVAISNMNFDNDYVLWVERRAGRRSGAARLLPPLRQTGTATSADRVDDEEKRRYISSRLAQVDSIVIDDTYVQWYDHCPQGKCRPSITTTSLTEADGPGQDLQELCVVRTGYQTTGRVHLPPSITPRVHLPQVLRRSEGLTYSNHCK